MKFISFLNKYKYDISLMIFGLLIFTYPMLKTGFDLMPGDGLDQKSLSYILEHSFQWLIRTPKHEYYWTAPFYYPYQNNIAFSDSMMGLDPIYWVLRIFWKPLSAFQALLVALCIINYTTFYYLSKKIFKLSDLASSFGGFIFGFGLLRFFRTIHINYFSQFYTILALIFLFKVNKKNSPLKNHIYMFLAALCTAMQFYSCYTLGWGFCVLFFVGILFSFCFSGTRKKVVAYIKDFYKLLFIYFIVFIVILIPYVKIYLDLGLIRNMEDVAIYLQNQFCWVRSLSRLDNLFLKDVPYVGFFERGEITASSGIVTTIISLVGLWFSSKIAKTKGLRWILYFILILVFFMTCTVNSFFLWDFLYGKIIGTDGIRAIIRLAFIGLIVVSLGVAYFMQNLQSGKLKAKIILVISAILLLVEQIPYYTDPNSYWITYGWSKSVFEKQIQEEVKEIDDSYDAILFIDEPHFTKEMAPDTFRNQMYMTGTSITALAMWTALEKNMYSLNGLSGVAKRGVPIRKSIKIYQKVFVNDLDTFNDRKYFLEDIK